jgi:hypothetical protein
MFILSVWSKRDKIAPRWRNISRAKVFRGFAVWAIQLMHLFWWSCSGYKR